MESPLAYPDSPLDQDDMAYPCKGCGEILEEGKAFELAGNRWHIDCFRCNTCGTLLDSDANLLLLGDGSLICNNCTYSCSSCGNKIEDLAILTGDQAFCANCFKCRNCKKKIENLRYARTSQGIFCMDCHEKIQARRRKRTTRSALQRQKLSSNNSVQLDKSLPAIPPSMSADSSFIPELETPPPEIYSELPAEVIPRAGSAEDTSNHTIKRREQSPAIAQNDLQGRTSHPSRHLSFANAEFKGTLALPPNKSKINRNSTLSQRSDQSGAEEFLIPLAFDPTQPAAQSPQMSSQRTNGSTTSRSRDYFGAKPPISSGQKVMADKSTSQSSSPHIAFQEIGRQMQPTDSILESSRTRNDGSSSGPGSTSASPQVGLEKHRRQFAESPRASQSSREGISQNDRFKLQEVPKTKRSGGSARSSRSEAIPSHSDQSAGLIGNENETKVQTVKDVQHVNAALVEEPESLKAMTYATPRISQEYQQYEAGEPEAVHDSEALQHPNVGHLHDLPKRGDSLQSSKIGQTIPRKELPASSTVPLASGKASGEAVGNTAKSAGDEVSHATKVNGGKVISNPIESPMSKSILDTPNQAQSRPDTAGGESVEDSFVAPRAPPLPPSDAIRTTNGFTSTFQSDGQRATEQPLSPSLLRYSAGGDFSLDEDMARILGGDEPSAQDSFLRRVSNSVRHGRSFSDKGTRLSKEQRWPRSPATASGMVGQEISSPSSASPEHRDELAWFRNELRRERQKTVEREQKIAELEATLESTANIKQVNTELREKRSTMVVLDTQKEIVVRELEVLTEHIAAAKRSGDPLDLGKMRNVVLRDFAEALQRLKDSFAPQIEDSIQKRNDLVDEISSLTQMKDKSFQEFEQLSLKNAQLADLNNQLVHQIQELYKANSGAATESARQAPNGLGIYSHHKDKSQVSIDSREARTAFTENSIPGSGTTLQQEEAEPVTVLQGPQVVNIRKGQPKKFNWKKGGQNVAKGVTKGLKGAFSSTQQSYSRELQFAETTPYGATLPGQEYASILRTGNEPVRQGFGLFGNPKAAPKGNAPWKSQLNGSSSALPLDASTCLYGSDLEQRAEYERVDIPVIVTRCIQEVELRGMDVEGIYRKSGGTSQIQIVKDGFERTPNDFDLSDPDLDIHAVTSGLKQYFRRLPMPLITYEVYDKLLDTTNVPDHEKEKRIEVMHRALADLPKVHRDVLEFLTFHLKRVVERESENLMTSMNIAVVFAPTIMRPESLSREMTDTARKNEVVQFLVENCQAVFMGPH